MKHDNERWTGPVGEDAINLKASLAAWLGPRLLYLADHTTNAAPGSFESDQAQKEATEVYFAEMRQHGTALVAFAETEGDEKAAELAMHWVAENFIHLWD